MLHCHKITLAKIHFSSKLPKTMSHPKTSNKEINISILSQMLKAGDNFVSGNDIADSLNISRVSIWSHLKKLRSDGFDFEAIQNRGYRLLTQPSIIHPDLLAAYLKLNETELPIIYLSETDSTNSEAERQLTNKVPTPFVVVTNKQTQGRGRHGRSWFSNDSGNLYLSFAFKPNIAPSLIKSFTPWIAAQLCHHLNQQFNLSIQLKWPNDLVFNGKKICGMLAESRIDVDHTRDLIFGIGLNINGDPHAWPQELQQIATSIEATSNTPFNINKMSASVISCILSSYNQFIHNQWQASLPSLWSKYDSLYDKHVQGFHGSTPIDGTAKGIDNTGSLKLLQKNGKLLLLDVGEISLSSPIKIP